MTYDEQTGEYTLSSGRRVASFTGVIGIGRDQVVRVGGESVPGDPWTDAERAELADAMIARWTAFKGGDVTALSPDLQTTDT